MSPTPSDWFTHEKKSALLSELSSASQVLKLSGLLDPLLIYWIKSNVASYFQWDTEDEISYLDNAYEQWSKVNDVNLSSYSPDEVRHKLKVTRAFQLWCEQQWNGHLNSIYLRRKEGLDTVSYQMLRVSEKYLSLELYHQLKDREISFDRAVLQFSSGPERKALGVFPKQTIESVPLGLAPILKRLQVGEVSTPIRLTKDFCIVQLLSYKSSQLNDNMANFLMSELQQKWLDQLVLLIKSELQW